MWSSQVTTKIAVIWDMMQCTMVDTYCLSHYIVSCARRQLPAVALSFFARTTHKQDIF